VPTAEARSSAPKNRSRLTSRAARRCCHLQAVHTVDRLSGHAAPRTGAGSGGREATVTFTIPRVALAPENHLAMALRHPTGHALRRREHADEAFRSRHATPDVAAGGSEFEARPKTIGHAPPRTGPASLRPRPETWNRELADVLEIPAEMVRRPPSNARDAMRGKSDARSTRSRNTRRLLEQTLTAFHGVLHPTTLAEASSDLHRVYLTRLCCAFRFSQPLDALFRPQPLRPCFMPVTPLGFRFQRFSLPGSGRRLSTPPSLRAVSNDRHAAPARMVTSRPATTRVCAPEESVPTGPVLPGIRRPILS
jgi:hypothetical protein